MSRDSDCPSANDWRGFVLGQSSEAEAEKLERHLGTCRNCLDTLESLQTEDMLVEAVRNQSGADQPEDPAVADLMTRLEKRAPAERPQGVTAQVPVLAGVTENPTVTPSNPATDIDGPAEAVACLAPPQAPDEIGRLGPYRVLRLLGSGGMGVVFLAEDTQLQRQVALKTLLPSLATRPSARQRFLREGRAAAAIEHEHVIPIFQVSEDRGVPFLAMPLLKGESLDDRVRREGRLPLAEVLRIGREIAEGLAAAHEHGVIHRDIKPGNVWLEGDRGWVKILDFGLARAGAGGAQLTQQGMIIGTPAFMAPEQISGQAVDGRADLFSLGCVLYRLATGELPFPIKDTVATLMAVATETPKPPRALCPDLPETLDELIRLLLAKAPEERLPSARVVAAALAAIAADRTQIFPASLVPPALRRQGSKRKRLLAVAAVLLCAFLAAGLVVYRMATDQGEIEFVREDPGLAPEVVIQRNGMAVAVVDLNSQRNVVLHSGDYTLRLAGNPRGLTIDAPGTLTLMRGDKKTVRVRQVSIPPPPMVHRIQWLDAEQGFPAFIGQTGISADGKLFFGAGDAGPTGSIRIFEVATGKLVHDLRPGSEVWFSNAAFVPGGKYLLAGYSKDNDLYLWDITTGKVVRKLTGHSEPALVAVAPDGKQALSCSPEDRTVRLWDLESGKELRKLEGHTEKAAGVFSPDGKKVLTFSPDKTLRVWDVETGKEQQKLTGHEDACSGCFSPDGKQVLSFSGDHTVRLWEVASGKEVRRFEGPGDKVGSALFVAGGKQVVANCDDRHYRVWETASGKLLCEIDLTQFGEDHWSMTASPDGRWGLVSHQDGTVRLFDLTSGEEAHRYLGCPKARAFSFSLDGRVVVAGSFRQGMYVFQLPMETQTSP
jgi:serine/threonine protein kinase/WD40 repeat protein